MSTFTALGIRKDYIQGLHELGIKVPSEIQEKAIPILLKSKQILLDWLRQVLGKQQHLVCLFYKK